MLVLSRHEKQNVIIKLEDGREIKVTLIKINNLTKALLGFEADPTINIVREEIVDRKINKSTTP